LKSITMTTGTLFISQKFTLVMPIDYEEIINCEVKDLNGNRKKEQKVPQKAVIGIGAGKNYTLYDVGTDNTQFVQAGYKSEKRIKGFGML